MSLIPPDIFPPLITTYTEQKDDYAIITRVHQNGNTLTYYTTLRRHNQPHPTFIDTTCTVDWDKIHLRPTVSNHKFRQPLIDVTIPNPYSPAYTIGAFLGSTSGTSATIPKHNG